MKTNAEDSGEGEGGSNGQGVGGGLGRGGEPSRLAEQEGRSRLVVLGLVRFIFHPGREEGEARDP